jgi:hypothetical protein
MRLRAPLPDLAARRGPLKLSATNTISSPRNQTEIFSRSSRFPEGTGRESGRNRGGPGSGPRRHRRATGSRKASIAGPRPLTCAYASLRVPLPDLRRHLRTEPPHGGIRRSGGLSRRARRHGETPVDRRGRHRRVGVRARPAPVRRGRRRVLRRRLLRLTDQDFSGSLQLFFARILRAARACRTLRPYEAPAQAGHGSPSGHARLPLRPRPGGHRRARTPAGSAPPPRPPAPGGR